ncbi:MAG: hypothetical protein WDM76_07935 [Limisphaerales bacterium]
MSLVREFFGYSGIPATPENFRRFFDNYVFWLDHILAQSQTRICPGVWELLRDFHALPAAPDYWFAHRQTSDLARKSSSAIFNLWEQFEFGGFADDHEERDLIAAARARPQSSRARQEIARAKKS